MLKRYRRTVAIVTYSKEKGKTYFLILKRKLHWKGWEFPKGGVKRFETKRKAIKREIKEETGQIPIKIKKFNFKGKYNYQKDLKDRPGISGNKYYLYATEIKKRKVNFDKREHSGYKWTLFNEAIKKLTWPNQKKCLSVVYAWLENKK